MRWYDKTMRGGKESVHGLGVALEVTADVTLFVLEGTHWNNGLYRCQLQRTCNVRASAAVSCGRRRRPQTMAIAASMADDLAGMATWDSCWMHIAVGCTSGCTSSLHVNGPRHDVYMHGTCFVSPLESKTAFHVFLYSVHLLVDICWMARKGSWS